MIAEFDLGGKHAVVSGISYGIGREIAKALAEAGARVAGYYHGDTPTEEVAAELRSVGQAEPFVARADAADWDQVNAFADEVMERFGRIDIWVNNAARLFVRPFLEVSLADFRSVLSLNLDGYFIGSRVAAERMKANGWGRIIQVSSMASLQPTNDMSVYATAKGGINTLTRAMAIDLAPYGITVNSVSPGAIETPLNAVAYTPEVRERYGQRIALGRIGSAREAALPVVFVASEAAAYMTGADLICDGGLLINGRVGHARTD